MSQSVTPPPPPPAPQPFPAATPPGGGMPGWLIVLIVVVLVLSLGCCGFWTACHFMCSAAQKGLSAATQAAADQMKENARKAGVNYSENGNAVSLPSNFPSDVPVYSGMKPIQSVSPPGQQGGQVTFQGNAGLQALADYYKTQLTGKGWDAQQAIANGDSNLQFFAKGDQSITVLATSDGPQATVVVTYGKK